MIYGYIKDLGTYKGECQKNLDIALDYILDKKYLNNHFGKNEILGDKYILTVQKNLVLKLLKQQNLKLTKNT